MQGLMSGGGEKQLELIWTNPNPNSDFGAQTISLNLSKYKQVLILASIGLGGYVGGVKNIPSSGAVSGTFGGQPGTDGMYVGERTYNVALTGVTFGQGIIANFTGGYSYTNSYYIPQKIYGLKKEVF